jgi:lysophospholipase L1-like esterase
MTFWGKRAVLIAVAVLTLAACGLEQPKVDPDIQVKADAFSAKVEAEIKSRDASADEAKLVNVTLPKDRPLRVLFAGNGITGGFFASIQSNGFSQLVGASLAKVGAVEEVRGPNAGGQMDNLGGFLEVPADLDLAVVQLGSTEAGDRMDTAAFSNAYSSALHSLKEKSQNIGIVCLSVWQSTGANAGAYDRIIQEQCQSVGGQFISVSLVFSNVENRGPEGLPTWAGTSDTFHPNDAGHLAIAELILERINVS